MSVDQRIPVDQLKVGDTVGIRERVTLGWKAFRYPVTIPKSIRRITPKRTKIVTDDGCEYNVRNTWFYVVDEDAKRKNEVVLCAKTIGQFLYDLERARNSGELFSASDEKIVAAAALLDEVRTILFCEEENCDNH